MATNNISRLDQVTLDTVNTTITTGTAANTLIKGISIVNTGVTTETVTLFIGGSAAANQILRVILNPGESGHFDGTIVVNSGQSLSGTLSTTNDSVTVTTYGMDMT